MPHELLQFQGKSFHPHDDVMICTRPEMKKNGTFHTTVNLDS
jgi:hypothetical protein